MKATSPADIKRMATAIFEDRIRNRDEDTLLEVAEAARSGRPHFILSENFSSRRPGHRPSAREVSFQYMAALAAAGLHEMGLSKGAAQEGVARLAMKSGWRRKVTADIIRDWIRGRPNRETAIDESCGRMFIELNVSSLRTDLPPLTAWAFLIRRNLSVTLIVPATSEDDWDF
jgi:hypothetical protein